MDVSNMANRIMKEFDGANGDSISFYLFFSGDRLVQACDTIVVLVAKAIRLKLWFDIFRIDRGIIHDRGLTLHQGSEFVGDFEILFHIQLLITS